MRAVRRVAGARTQPGDGASPTRDATGRLRQNGAAHEEPGQGAGGGARPVAHQRGLPRQGLGLGRHQHLAPHGQRIDTVINIMLTV